jgi:hypothetical protein
VNAVEAVGEQFEIEASLGAATAAPSVADLGDVAITEASVGIAQSQPVTSPSNELAAVDAPSSVVASPGDVERAAAIPKPKPRGL